MANGLLKTMCSLRGRRGADRQGGRPTAALALFAALSAVCVGAVGTVRAADPARDAGAVGVRQVGDDVLQLIAEQRAGGAGLRVSFPVDFGALHEVYAARDEELFWVAGARSRARLLLDRLRAAEREGLRPSDYKPEALAAELAAARTPDELARVEVLMSGAYLRYAADLREGRLNPERLDATLSPDRPSVVPVAALRGAMNSGDLDRHLDRLVPATPMYRELRRLLREYRTLAAQGGWPVLAEGETLRPGMTGQRVAALRQRLHASQDITVYDSEPDRFDAGLEQAVRRFQKRHGLTVDGLVGPNTYAALNVPVEARIRQIEVNMERWRWMPDELGERYVMVNLAGQQVELVDSGFTELRMRAVVGKPYRETPVFSDTMTYLDFNPTWTVPPTILEEDILPELRENPQYLAENDMTLYAGWSADAPVLDASLIDWDRVNPKLLPYRIVQAPGPENPLGRVKFMFPNRHHIYLHDTPSRHLFDRPVRAFSSGCIRVEDPAALASALLAGSDGWTPERVAEELADPEPNRVRLADPLPVHLTYSTVWIGEGGTVNFRPDVYGRDARLAEALAAELN
jgi:murein L,D-transpeptidase YcbB/YkuD